MAKQDWIWMPHAGHFICGHDCRFRLNTYVNGYIVSTVGEYWPDSQIRKIIAETRRINIRGKGDDWNADYMKKIGFDEIGADRKYETMVFKAKKQGNDSCCPYRIDSGIELDFEGYNESRKAYQGHLKLCEKWDKINDQRRD